MKTINKRNIPRPNKKVAIFANWFRVGVIGLLALPSLLQLITGIIWRIRA
jgi:hypothetical protein